MFARGRVCVCLLSVDRARHVYEKALICSLDRPGYHSLSRNPYRCERSCVRFSNRSYRKRCRQRLIFMIRLFWWSDLDLRDHALQVILVFKIKSPSAVTVCTLRALQVYIRFKSFCVFCNFSRNIFVKKVIQKVQLSIV